MKLVIRILKTQKGDLMLELKTYSVGKANGATKLKIHLGKT